MNNREVVIVSGVRTAIGGFMGSLKDVSPTKLGAIVLKEALDRAGIAPADVGHVVFGNVIHTEPRDMYMSRAVALDGGIPPEVPCLTVNRLCGSGLQAVISAAQSILLGDADVAVAGGAESMSRGPHSTAQIRSGVRMGDVKCADMMLGALTDPFGNGHMGITGENVAKRWQVTRDEQDLFALVSHQRATLARDAGHFGGQIVPVITKSRGKEIKFEVDEHVKPETTLGGLGKLRPAFDPAGSVTAGNSSGVNDGAAAVVLMEADAARAAGIQPFARIVGYAHAGVEPEIMGIAPVHAVVALLKKTGLQISDFDIVESNEAFASQSCAVIRELGFDPERVNPNGGAIALGHPIGATGAILTVKLIHELRRTGGRFGLITMCIGGGQGIALAVERMGPA